MVDISVRRPNIDQISPYQQEGKISILLPEIICKAPDVQYRYIGNIASKTSTKYGSKPRSFSRRFRAIFGQYLIVRYLGVPANQNIDQISPKKISKTGLISHCLCHLIPCFDFFSMEILVSVASDSESIPLTSHNCIVLSPEK